MLIKDCACGEDHETMPMIDIGCSCNYGPFDVHDCGHEDVFVPAVCVRHKRHIPCRSCHVPDV